ncbi:hypothetical protein [Dyella jiangningensis]
MMIIGRTVNAVIPGMIFFACVTLVIIVFSYVLAQLKGLKYVFHDALAVGVQNGLALGVAIAILTFIIPPRR